MRRALLCACAAVLSAQAAAGAGSGGGGGTVDLYTCGRPDCATVPPNSVCGLVAHQLPTNGSCTWNSGPFCFTAALDPGSGLLAAAGYAWLGSCDGACGGVPVWGAVSGVAVDGLPGCQPVQGGHGGGAYAQWA